jgi:hypothetical protein
MQAYISLLFNTFTAMLLYWDFTCWISHFSVILRFWTCSIWNGNGKEQKKNAGLEVLTTVTMKSTVLWYVMLFSQVEVYIRFRETYCLHLHGQKVSQANNQQEASSDSAVIVYFDLSFNKVHLHFLCIWADICRNKWHLHRDSSSLDWNSIGTQ